jgi:hypothetical protein
MAADLPETLRMVMLTVSASSLCMQMEEAPSFGSCEECNRLSHGSVLASGSSAALRHTALLVVMAEASSCPEENQ